MVILVLNCGSSSVKYQLLEMNINSNSLLAKGLVERIGLETGKLTHKSDGKERFEIERDIPDHTTAIKLVLEKITEPSSGVLTSLQQIDAVGHRVAHGGEFFSKSELIDKEVIKKIEKCSEIAPLHNPANLLGINAISRLMPSVKQVAVFDTSFHQSIPEYAYMYAIPYEYYKKYKIRRYGFHGTSHKFVAKKGAELAGIDFNNSKIITCHLGNGGSVTAILNGKSVDTSMGFTPLEGLVMGTRSGDIDAGVVTFLQEKEGWDAAGINSILNRKSGFLGIYGKSSDARDIERAAEKGDSKAELVLEMFKYRVLKYIGAYMAAMNGVDLIIFTGGIGENDPVIREYVGKNLSFIGVDFNSDANNGLRGKDLMLTNPTSKVRVASICTNEELVIATDTMNLI